MVFAVHNNMMETKDVCNSDNIQGVNETQRSEVKV